MWIVQTVDYAAAAEYTTSHPLLCIELSYHLFWNCAVKPLQTADHPNRSVSAGSRRHHKGSLCPHQNRFWCNLSGYYRMYDVLLSRTYHGTWHRNHCCSFYHGKRNCNYRELDGSACGICFPVVLMIHKLLNRKFFMVFRKSISNRDTHSVNLCPRLLLCCML